MRKACTKGWEIFMEALIRSRIGGDVIRVTAKETSLELPCGSYCIRVYPLLFFIHHRINPMNADMLASSTP